MRISGCFMTVARKLAFADFWVSWSIFGSLVRWCDVGCRFDRSPPLLVNRSLILASFWVENFFAKKVDFLGFEAF